MLSLAFKKKLMIVALTVSMIGAFFPAVEAKAKEMPGTDVICNDNPVDLDTSTTTEAPSDGNSGGGNSGGGLNDFTITMGEGGITTSLDNSGDSKTVWEELFSKYKTIILGVSGIATLTFILLFIKSFLLIGANSDNPSGRREAINGCLWTGIATALCGSVMVVVGLFWNAFK